MRRILPIFFFMFLLFPLKAFAVDCNVSVSPSNVLGNVYETFVFSVNNYTAENTYKWIRLSITSEDIDLNNPGADGWIPSGDRSQGIFSNASGGIAPGQSQSFSFVDSGAVLGPASIVVSAEASTNEDGSGAISCGSATINIVSEMPIAPTINNASLTIGNTSAILTWNTNVATTGTVNYGTKSGYGSSVTTVSGTAHSATMSSLSSSTTFHYQISVSASGGTSNTTDATFTTSAATVTSTTTTTVTNTTTVVITPSPAPKDVFAPSVSISNDFSKPYKEAPTIEGKATDGGAVNVGISSIEYSLDGGKNWLPVDNIDTVGKRSVTYDFTPVGLDDGNYQVKVRAKDISGNIGSSKAFTMVIDRLPPQVGGTLFSLGPMILKPDAGGTIYSIAGIEIKATLSAVGGPIFMDLFFDSQKYSLTKNIESGLWNGTLAFDKTGSFPLKIKSIDGANNETERSLSTIVSLPPGVVSDENNKPIQKAKIKIYTFEKTLNDFTLWDGLPFSQVNPQETDKDGQYRLILPSGKYFIEVEASGKRKLRSDIFELSSTTPINQNLKLDNAFLFLGNWWSKTVTLSLAETTKEPAQKNILLGKPMPDFDISSGTNLINNTIILGKPTILSFLSSWEPQTSDQLLEMDSLQTEYPGINVIAIISQESPSKVEVFKKLGGYGLPVYADRDGVLVVPLGLESLPTHIFLDRKGIIKDVTVGFLDRDDLLNKILE